MKRKLACWLKQNEQRKKLGQKQWQARASRALCIFNFEFHFKQSGKPSEGAEQRSNNHDLCFFFSRFISSLGDKGRICWKEKIRKSIKSLCIA